ncbi:MAG: hypothetical protein WA637_06540 [Terriglobales bacterium]
MNGECHVGILRVRNGSKGFASDEDKVQSSFPALVCKEPQVTTRVIVTQQQ